MQKTQQKCSSFNLAPFCPKGRMSTDMSRPGSIRVLPTDGLFRTARPKSRVGKGRAGLLALVPTNFSCPSAASSLSGGSGQTLSAPRRGHEPPKPPLQTEGGPEVPSPHPSSRPLCRPGTPTNRSRSKACAPPPRAAPFPAYVTRVT